LLLLWNVHKIRKQSNRLNSVSGQPLVNYQWPAEGVQNFGIAPDLGVTAEIQQDIDNWGELIDTLINIRETANPLHRHFNTLVHNWIVGNPVSKQ
jgi:hypothetical protein